MERALQFLTRWRWQIVVLVVVVGLLVRTWVMRNQGSQTVDVSAVQVHTQVQEGTVVGKQGDPRQQVFVHIAGAVRRPGLYHVVAGKRVGEVLRQAGGATHRADLAAINLAKRVSDGQQIIVPTQGKKQEVASAGRANMSTQPAADGKVHLNTATLEQLDGLDGVGPVTAKKILDYRRQHGKFSSVQELDQIPGIGEKRLAALRTRVTL